MLKVGGNFANGRINITPNNSLHRTPQEAGSVSSVRWPTKINEGKLAAWIGYLFPDANKQLTREGKWILKQSKQMKSDFLIM